MWPVTHNRAEVAEISRLSARLAVLKVMRDPYVKSIHDLHKYVSESNNELSKYYAQIKTTEQEAQSALASNKLDVHKKKVERLAYLNREVEIYSSDVVGLKNKIEYRGRQIRDTDHEIAQIERILVAMGVPGGY